MKLNKLILSDGLVWVIIVEDSTNLLEIVKVKEYNTYIKWKYNVKQIISNKTYR